MKKDNLFVWLFFTVVAFIQTLATVTGALYLFNILFYPYNYLFALIYSSYKKRKFKNHKEFRKYAFKGKFGLISFFTYMFLASLTMQFGFGFAPVIIACILIFPFFFLTFMPLLKNLRDEEYPDVNCKSYLPLLVPLLFFIWLFIALVFGPEMKSTNYRY